MPDVCCLHSASFSIHYHLSCCVVKFPLIIRPKYIRSPENHVDFTLNLLDFKEIEEMLRNKYSLMKHETLSSKGSEQTIM